VGFIFDLKMVSFSAFWVVFYVTYGRYKQVTVYRPKSKTSEPPEGCHLAPL